MLVKINVTALGDIDYTDTTFWKNRKVDKNIVVKFTDSFVCEQGQENESAKKQLQIVFDDIAKISQRKDCNSVFVGNNFSIYKNGHWCGYESVHGTFDKGICIDDFKFTIDDITPIKDKSMRWCIDNLTSEMFIKEFGNIVIKDLTK